MLLDASALLAFLLGEPGHDQVEAGLASALISAANWAEVLQKVDHHGGSAAENGSQMLALGLEVEPVWREDAQLAATLWSTNATLSLADRLCLATATRLEIPVLTADRSWLDADCEATVIAIR